MKNHLAASNTQTYSNHHETTIQKKNKHNENTETPLNKTNKEQTQALVRSFQSLRLSASNLQFQPSGSERSLLPTMPFRVGPSGVENDE